MKTAEEKQFAKMVKGVKDTIKGVLESRKKGKTITELPVDTLLKPVTVVKAVMMKKKIENLESQLSALQDQYKVLRQEILDNLPGEENDKVRCVVSGVQIEKYVKVNGAGKLDTEKLTELAKQKRILLKITKQSRVFDEDLIMQALNEGLITYEEYVNCLSVGNVVPNLKLEETPEGIQHNYLFNENAL